MDTEELRENPARRPPRLLCRREHGDREPRSGHRAFGTPIYVYHEIVHNKYVVDTFRDKGAVFVDVLDEVPDGRDVLFSAHGVSPEIRRVARERKLHAIDATCPLVTKVHLEAVRYAKEGYTILLIGHEGHDEVVGTMGEAPQAMVLVESVDACRPARAFRPARSSPT